MITHWPLFYYNGSKRWDIPSDKGFIEKMLLCLTPEKQAFAAQQYDDTYLYYWNRGRPLDARKRANTQLHGYVKQNYDVATSEIRKRHHALEERLKQVRAVQQQTNQRNRPRINLGD